MHLGHEVRLIMALCGSRKIETERHGSADDTRNRFGVNGNCRENEKWIEKHAGARAVRDVVLTLFGHMEGLVAPQSTPC